MSIKLIVSDIDGTLQPFHGEISKRTRDAVRACADHGVTFCIATGRWFITALDAAQALGQTDGCMIIASGGQIVRMDASTLAEWYIPEEKAWQVYEVLRRYDVMFNVYTRGAFFRLNTAAYHRRENEPTSYLGGAYRVSLDDREDFEKHALKHPSKLEIYARNEGQFGEIREILTAQGFCVTSSHHSNLEIGIPGLDKGTAVKWLANHLGVSREECLAMGDNTNDRSMLDAVGWSVAMGNAVPELKAAARIVAPDAADDGAAQIIERALEGRL